MTKFPMRIYVKEYHPVYSSSEPGWFWKSLCVVYDNESLGLMERLLAGTEIEHRAVSVEEPKP